VTGTPAAEPAQDDPTFLRTLVRRLQGTGTIQPAI
jgi:hypothetical protein